MGIPRNAGFGRFLNEPGEYVAVIDKVEWTKTKPKTDPKTGQAIEPRDMLKVFFFTDTEQEIVGYFVKGLKFHMKAYDLLKESCGLPKEAKSADLVGKSVGILVEMQKPDEMGKSFPQIVGYGPASEVSKDSDTGFAKLVDEGVPF
jgi:hypothetical protein